MGGDVDQENPPPTSVLPHKGGGDVGETLIRGPKESFASSVN